MAIPMVYNIIVFIFVFDFKYRFEIFFKNSSGAKSGASSPPGKLSSKWLSWVYLCRKTVIFLKYEQSPPWKSSSFRDI